MTRARTARRSPAIAVCVSIVGFILVATAPVLVSGPAAAGSVAGGVLHFGSAEAYGSLAGTSLDAPVVGMAATPAFPGGAGYWLVASDGGVFTFGNAPFDGSMGGHTLDAPVVGMAATPDGGGYWLVASDGGVFAFGNAAFDGSMGGHTLDAPIVGMAATPDGSGYWLVASDGGVFAFGTAAFEGSMGGKSLDAPVVGIATTPNGGGYWLVASDGGVFAFGNAAYDGSMGGHTLDAPVVGIAAAGGSGGYWMTASDGGVFAFGGAPYEGSGAGSQLAQPVAGIATDPLGTGYWLVEGAPLAGKVVAIDPGHNGGNAADPGYINAPVWNGREEEACDTAGAATDSGYSEAQFNFNVAQYLAADLRAQGATVVLTRDTNTGVGPCVTERAAIGNNAHADAAVAIHADGGPPGGRGFAILEPVADGPNDGVITSSAALGTDLRNSFLAGTGEPVSSYDGVNGIQPRDDLGGINLTTVPKVFIECANMRNATDAALVVSPAWQQRAAAALDSGITEFLRSR
jgi:N-acetylmuramoyl-L-alanine amidase